MNAPRYSMSSQHRTVAPTPSDGSGGRIADAARARLRPEPRHGILDSASSAPASVSLDSVAKGDGYRDRGRLIHKDRSWIDSRS